MQRVWLPAQRSLLPVVPDAPRIVRVSYPDNSRERFEARQARLEAETAAREAKRAARKAAAQSQAAKNGSDPIQEAIERAKARKAEQEPNP